MLETDNILELNFSGNGINPDVVKPSEIATQIVNFENVLCQVIKNKHPEIDTEQVLFSFCNIGNNSLDIFFKPLLAIPLVISSYLLITESINNNNYTQIPSEATYALKNIVKFTKTYECVATFKLNNNELSKITNETQIKKMITNVFKGDTVIYGKLIDIGGEKPNLHLKVNEDYKVTIDIPEDEAQKLAIKLYQYIGLKGEAVWDAETFKVMSFKYSSIVIYNEGNSFKTVQQIKNNITSGVWDKYNTTQEINDALFRNL
ncbi:MAG: hypothetical protein LLF80_01290 [Porphyromonadaceae bacterium]|nr:hypothetical protein [Porphyromonadaceae bacterium]